MRSRSSRSRPSRWSSVEASSERSGALSGFSARERSRMLTAAGKSPRLRAAEASSMACSGVAESVAVSSQAASGSRRASRSGRAERSVMGVWSSVVGRPVMGLREGLRGGIDSRRLSVTGGVSKRRRSPLRERERDSPGGCKVSR